MDVDADVVPVREKRSPRMDARTHPNRTGRKRFGQLCGSGKRGGRRLERKEERVALRIDLSTLVASARPAYVAPVSFEDIGVRVLAELVAASSPRRR
jgi:hypothetical protein